MAVIRSHSACACPGPVRARRSTAATASSRSRARISGSVTVPSSRSVPGVLPVRSAGPETSSTSSRIWKARPMRRANAPSASASGLLARGQGAQPAGRLEQRRGLQLAAEHVALDRDACRRMRPRAGAARPRRAPSWPARGRCSCGDVLVARQLGEGAGEQQVPGRERRVAPGDRRRRSAAPCAALAPSMMSSCTSEAEWTSSTATPARTRPSWPCGPSGGPPPACAASITSSGRRRLPPALTVAWACCASGTPALRGHAREVLLGAPHAALERFASETQDRVEPVEARSLRVAVGCGGAAPHAGSAGTVPAWIATIPPAVMM